jgi:alpha-L-rhamnosidase
MTALPADTPIGSAPMRVRVEQLCELVATSVRAPRLSWWLPEGATEQRAYQIRVQEGASTSLSEPMPSSDHVLVGWPDDLPVDDTAVTRWLSVRVWTDLGVSDWSQPAAWELLPPRRDWSAHWISPVEEVIPPLGSRPVYELRTTVRLDRPVERARIWATAEGVYEIFVADERVGDQELAPGFTSYHSRLQLQRYDVRDLIAPGDNEIRVLLSDGWFRGRLVIERSGDNFGTATAFLMQALIEDVSGSIRSQAAVAWRCRAERRPVGYTRSITSEHHRRLPTSLDPR